MISALLEFSLRQRILVLGLACLVLFLVLAALACHFLLNVIQHDAESTDTDSDPETGTMAHAVMSQQE